MSLSGTAVDGRPSRHARSRATGTRAPSAAGGHRGAARTGTAQSRDVVVQVLDHVHARDDVGHPARHRKLLGDGDADRVRLPGPVGALRTTYHESSKPIDERPESRSSRGRLSPVPHPTSTTTPHARPVSTSRTGARSPWFISGNGPARPSHRSRRRRVGAPVPSRRQPSQPSADGRSGGGAGGAGPDRGGPAPRGAQSPRVWPRCRQGEGS